MPKFTLLNSVDEDIASNKSESSTATIVKKIIIFISAVYCTPTLKDVEGGGRWGRGKSGAFVNFSFEFSYLSSVSRSFIEIRIFDIDETLPDIKMDKMLSTSVL